ncbi:MAG: FAD-dependent oxidoreductase [Streptosporangiaceae bacterium]
MQIAKAIIETPRPRGERADLVVIGNGIAGMTAAIEARKLEPRIRIVIVTAQNHPTINTPVLKQFTIGGLARAQLIAYPLGTERALDLEMLHARVTGIRARDRALVLADGSACRYGRLLIATGSRPVGLPETLPGNDLDGVLTPHRLPDYLDLARRLQAREEGEVREVVVVGGGLHACETVESLLRRGLVVHWLLRGDRLYARALDRRASDLAIEHFRGEGAHIWQQTELVGILGRIGCVVGVATTQHEHLSCQLVLICTGTVPALELAHTCDPPLETTRGIQVDTCLGTSLAGIFAAGDVAALKNPWTGRYETRGQWAAAVEQGRRAALALTERVPGPPRDIGAPWHATQLGTLTLLTVGMTRESSDTEALTHEQDGGYFRLTVRQNQLVGYLALGPGAVDGVGIKRLIDEEIPWSDAAEALLTGTFEAHTFFARHHTAQLRTSSGPLAEELSGQTPARGIPSSASLLPHDRRRGRGAHLAFSHKPWPSIQHEIHACIGCNACLLACPALADPLNIDTLNQETLSGLLSAPVVHFTRACYQCGACVDPCPVGLHRDAMMLWLKVCLLRADAGQDERGNSYVAQ